MQKQRGITRYTVNEEYEVVAWWENTSYGFRHLAELRQNGVMVGKAKACYHNRSWESYEYQSVIHAVINGSSLEGKEAIKQSIDQQALGQVDDSLGTIGAVMALGEIFGSSQSESNSWKARMLKAGFGEGIEMPEDWESLSESEKQTRLDSVIELLSKKGQ